MRKIVFAALLMAIAQPIAVRAQDPDMSIVAAQVRSQGFACDTPSAIELLADESQPDQAVYKLACDSATYRVKLIPDMAAEISKID